VKKQGFKKKIRRKRREHMVRWYYQSIFDELEEMKNYRESLSRQMYETNPRVLLPAPALPAIKMLPPQRTGLRVDIADGDREVIVTADILPGFSKKNISLTLISPHTLEISCERRDEKQEEKEGYFLQERGFGFMTRVIPLPWPVSEEGSRASFKDGVLEVHLKKSEKETKGKIPVS
jgi:HSP20 family protein